MMNGRSLVHAIRAGGLAAALVLLQLTAHAQVTFTTGTAVGASTVGNTVSVYANGGAVAGDLQMTTPPGTSSAMTVPAGSAQGWGWRTNSTTTPQGNVFNGMPTMETRTSGPIPGYSGAKVPLTTTASPTPAQMGKFFKASLGAASKIFYPLQVGMAMFEFAKEMGWILQDGPNGTQVYRPSDPTVCTVAPCYQYWFRTNGSLPFVQWYNDPDSAATAACAKYTATFSPGAYCNGYTITSPKPYGLQVNVTWHMSVGDRTETSNSQSIAPTPNPPKTLMADQEIADAIAAKSGWPSSSHIAEAAADAMNRGVPMDAALNTSLQWGDTHGSTVNITGKPTETTNTPTDPSQPATKTTTTTTYNITNNNDNTYTTNNTTNTITQTWNTSTGAYQITGTATTTSSPDQKPTDPQKDPCTTSPTRAGCAQLGDTPTGDALSKTSQAITVTPVQFSGGSCPAPVAFSAFGHSYAFAYTPLCDKLSMLAPLFMALAAFGAAWILSDSFKVT